MEMQSLSTGSSSNENEILVYLGAVVTGKPKKRKHNTWVREIFRNREKHGTLNLVRETAMADEEMFFRYMRMNPHNFEYLLSLVAPNITKQTSENLSHISLSLQH